MATLIVVTGALTGVFVGFPAAANAAAAGGTGDVGTVTFPGGPLVPPMSDTVGGHNPSFSGPPRGLPPQQGSSWTIPQAVPQTISHAASTVGGILSGTVDGLPDEGSSWT